eukprot:scaffold22660_cov127-Cylindrotheca_fusiformis.AAC.15
MLMKSLSIVLVLQTALSFQPILRRSICGQHSTSCLSSTAPSIAFPSLNATSFFGGRDLVSGVFFEKPIESETSKPTKAKSIADDLRSKSIVELKLQCSKRSIRYAGLEEHEEFVQAILNDMQELKEFSPSGHLVPGVVSDISDEILEEELDSDIPLLLDVYATFCGPCKLVAPEFEAAARKLGKNCRVAKLDSEKFHDVASKYKVKGLPTTLLIHKGEVICRREGTVSRHQLLDFADAFVPKQYW